MDFRPARMPAADTPERVSTAVEPEIPPSVARRIAKAVESSRSEGTRRTYETAWRRFTGWCEREGHVALPAHPVTVAAYLVDAADTRTETGERAYAAATFGTWIAAINHQHRTTGHLSPSAHELVTATLSGIRREYATAGDRPQNRRAPLLVDDIKILVETARNRCRGWADDVLERRDSAILLLGFAGAYRRSELSDLVCGDVTLHRLDGLHIRQRKSKTDQEGRGAVKALPYTDSHETCPPCAYVRWVQVVGAFSESSRRIRTAAGTSEVAESAPVHTHLLRKRRSPEDARSSATSAVATSAFRTALGRSGQRTRLRLETTPAGRRAERHPKSR